jgi:arginase
MTAPPSAPPAESRPPHPPHPPEVELIQVPYEVERTDSGGARGPAALLARGFLDRLRAAGWNVHPSEVWSRNEDLSAKAAIVAEVGRATARAVANAHSRGRFPLVLSGGCLTALGVVAGLERMGRDPGLVWIDAHGDFNTPESTPSGYWDGMALAAVCGRSLPEVYKAVELRPIHYKNVAHLAGRAFDPPEVEDIARLHLTVIPPAEIGSAEAERQIERCLAESKSIYLHIDLDGLDPRDAPAVNFPVPGGPPLDILLSCLTRLRPATALTLAGMSFERVDEEHARRMVETLVRLVEALLPARRGA